MNDKRKLEISIINKCFGLMGAEMVGDDGSVEDVKRMMYEMLEEYDADKFNKRRYFARQHLARQVK